MLKICITGEAGAGKSYVCGLLRDEFGFTVIDSDKITRGLMEPGESVYKRVVEAFGNEYIYENGTINRAKLANLVFNDEDKLELLNSISHPATIDRINELCEVCYANGERIVFIESAIALDSGYENFCDEFWYVHADYESRKTRLLDRGYSEEKIESIIDSQRDKEFFLENCDCVIDNSGCKSKEEIMFELQQLLDERQ